MLALPTFADPVPDVMFQISQIGNSKGAEKFLNDLKADKNIRRLLYLTSGKYIPLSLQMFMCNN